MDWQSYLMQLVAWFMQTWAMLSTLWLAAVRGDATVGMLVQSLLRDVQIRVLQATQREQLSAAVILIAVALVPLVRWQWASRVYRDPVMARAALLADVSLLMTQLRGRARRPARVTYASLKRRIARSRQAFDASSAERLIAQWKQADREVSALLTTLRRTKTHVVRIEQYRHLSTLRDTLHAQVHVSSGTPAS